MQNFVNRDVSEKLTTVVYLVIANLLFWITFAAALSGDCYSP